MTSRTSEKRTDRAGRRVQASPLGVYEALTRQDAVAAWLPPAGARGEIFAFEPRIGGAFRMTLHFTQDAAGKGKTSENSDTIKARFLALEPSRLVRWSVDFDSDDPDFAGTMIMSWILEAVNDGTQVAVVAEDVPPGITAADHQTGLRSSLDQLAKYVESTAR